MKVRRQGHINSENECIGGIRLNNLDLRQAIIQRVQNKSGEELTDVIVDSIGNDERTLPGLGVLFEIIWQKSSATDQNKMVAALHDHLHNNNSAAAINPS